MSNLNQTIETYEAKIESLAKRTDLTQFQKNGSICMNLFRISRLKSDDKDIRYKEYVKLLDKYTNLGYIKDINTD